MDLKHLRYFLAVATEGTFTAAAQRLGMTQPALSRAIRALEDGVGTALFARGHRGAELTAAGRMLAEDARGIDEYARAAIARVARFGQDGPRLRVTARACDVATLQGLVDSYNEQYEPHAVATVADWQVQADELRTGAADVGLLRVPFESRGLDSDPVRIDERVALLPRSHPLAGRESVDRAELAGEAFPRWVGMPAAETAYWTGTDRVAYEWRPGPLVRNGAEYASAVRLGQAVGFVPRTLLPELPLTGISVVPVSGLSPSELHVVWAATATSPDVARFVRHAQLTGV
ncbi:MULTISPECIES: LysR family transcriptional regulator [Amycolatopsis]|uniref:LysR family transcriptional regulator n=1 Tax=Amycolatopsis thermalba TaxID=944492 RepID=A0ABY4P609_9PSEU|nr:MULTISPECIES: LysR family transcriptional regulator [Amycolatopsis]OXM72202.1 ABC transporter substrate-binding protein [Amycolatopsis sp. KNN50.9b]UQS27613.1 LysR family transcriptional regulator [Amycolatopsis thermalba]